MDFENFKGKAEVIKGKKAEDQSGLFVSEKEKKELENWQNEERLPGETIEIRRRGHKPKKTLADQPDGIKDPGRRNFLKKLAIGAGAAITGIGVKEFFNSNEEIEKKPKPAEADNEKNLDQFGHVVDRLEWSIREKWMKSARAQEIRKIEAKEDMSPKEIAKELLRLFSDENERQELLRFFPKGVFEPDFFLAQQFQESRGQKEAVSKTGARGVYQNFPDSVIDCVEYLGSMRKKGLIPYRGPDKIDRSAAAKVIRYFAVDVNYGRAAGKIYLQAIFNPVSQYNAGKNPNAFKGRSITEIQGRLLAAYHDGPDARYKKDDELIAAAKKRAQKRRVEFDPRDAAVHYRDTVFDYMKEAGLVRNIYRKLDFKLEFEDTAVERMLHIFEKYGQENSREELTVKFKDILKLAKDKKGRDLSRSEIIDAFRPYL